MKKTLLLLSFLAINISILFAQAENDQLIEVDEMPYFSGCPDYENNSLDKRQCSNRNLVNFIAKNLVYPESAKTAEIEGTVIITFLVNEDGRVSAPYVLRDIGGGCGEAALDVIKLMPTWEPAIHNNNPVKVKLNLPVQFYLKDETEQISNGYSISWGKLKGKEVSVERLKKNLQAPVLVRDQFGNEISVNELVFSFSRKKRYLEERSSGKINYDMRKLVNKLKPGGAFSITAAIQIDGKFFYVERGFNLVE